MNSYRNFSANTSNLGKNLEKLSSGYKINRAGDDAAGLAISEKMRAQITGLEGATKNSKDGISLIQTAEGALTEVHDMLNRMTTLAEQSANGTYQDELDREQLQKEVESLKSEIDRIADSTNYNGLKLLDGSLDPTVDTKTVDTTQWTKITDDKLPVNSTSGVVGSGTILHKGESVAAQSAEFSINLNNFAPSFDINTASTNETDTVTITIGKGVGSAEGNVNQDLTVTAKEVAAQTGSDITERVAKAIVAKYNKDDGTATPSDRGIDVYGASGSQHFDISLGDDGSLKFIQTNAPEREADVVNTDLEVSISSTNAAGGTFTGSSTGDLDLTAANFAISDNVSIADRSALLTAMGDDDSTAFTITFGDADSQSDISEDDTLTFSAVAAPTGYTIQYQGSGADNWQNVASAGVVKLKAVGDTSGGNSIAGEDDGGGLKFPTVNFRIIKSADSSQVATFSVDMSKIAGSQNNKTATVTLNSKEGETNGAADYNAATTVIKEPTVSSSASLASTYITGNYLQTKITDGAQIKIGDETYTFALGAESNVDTSGENVVDLTDLAVNSNGQIDLGSDPVANPDYSNVNKALARLTKAAAGNKMYSVGYDVTSAQAGADNGHLTLTENKTYSGDADLTTRKGIAETIRFSAGATTSTNEDGIKGKGLSLQIGDTSDSFNKLTVAVGDMHSAAIGVGDVDISTQEGASDALNKIKTAINNVSDTRGTLGALQNRLEHTINNLGVQRENIQNAESLIRDTDVAEEMMTYTKNNILNQSAQAMLAQANQLPQGVLQLLQ